MRDDFHRAATALRLHGDAILACPRDQVERLRAYLIRLGRFIRDNAIVAAAAHELRSNECNDEVLLENREVDVVGRATEIFGRFVSRMQPTGPLPATAFDRIPGFDEDFRMESPRSLKRMIQEARRSASVTFSLDGIEQFTSVVIPRLRQLLASHGEAPEASEVIEIIDEFSENAREAARLSSMKKVVQRMSIGRHIGRLQDHADRWDLSMRGGSASVPLSEWIPFDLQEEAPIVVEMLAVQLEEGIARRHAIHRLRVWFEHFDCDALRAQLEDAERAEQPREPILQRHMDRFLFHDGYFPVTHAEASGGISDTLILERVERLERAKDSGLPPLLVELKQVLAFVEPKKASRTAVTNAIGSARGQVARYRNHMATRPHWSGLLPVIVVVHTCIEDLCDLEASDVVLIDLSTSPSRKRRSRPEQADPTEP